jgi:hypothetical protein
MKYWTYSLLLSIISCILLLVIFLLPDSFTVFKFTKTQVDNGVLFPVLLLSWMASLFGFALNNIFIDKHYSDNKPHMPGLKKYLPTLLGMPAFLSFVWFIFRWYKGKPEV